MKKLLAVLMAPPCCLPLPAASNAEKPNNNAVTPNNSNNNGTDSAELTPDIKLGFIYIGDASDRAYSYTHCRRQQRVAGSRSCDNEIISIQHPKTPTAKWLSTADRSRLRAIFGTNFGYENYMLAAAEHPEIEFFRFRLPGGVSGSANMHNYFGSIYRPVTLPASPPV